jgi:hypothetical protein
MTTRHLEDSYKALLSSGTIVEDPKGRLHSKDVKELFVFEMEQLYEKLKGVEIKETDEGERKRKQKKLDKQLELFDEWSNRTDMGISMVLADWWKSRGGAVVKSVYHGICFPKPTPKGEEVLLDALYLNAFTTHFEDGEDTAYVPYKTIREKLCVAIEDDCRLGRWLSSKGYAKNTKRVGAGTVVVRMGLKLRSTE